MSLTEIFKNFFVNLFRRKKPINNSQIIIENADTDVEHSQILKKFELRNVIIEKIEYLEQYIKIFSLTFPEEYNKYLSLIQKERNSYEDELKKYMDGFDGSITFSIDPEHETNRLIAITQLENKIMHFVEYDMNYQIHKNKFSKLCVKLNQFYNALIDTNKSEDKIRNQLKNAQNSLLRLIEEVEKMDFFNKDTRKKDDIFNYVIYCDYIMFKSLFRCKDIKSLDEYLECDSLEYNRFSDADYKKIIFKFFIDDLERLQLYIIKNFSSSTQGVYLLNTSQKLQEQLTLPKTQLEQVEYFEELIKFENTIDNVAEADNIAFVIDAPKDVSTELIEESVNKIALAFLNMLDNATAKILVKVIASFRYEISWREFFFLCKIFEIYDEAVDFASTTIFDNVKKNFVRLNEKYSQYTKEYIRENKAQLLKQSCAKNKKYILFLTLGSLTKEDVIILFDGLLLDYTFINNDLYLNHSYFNGFKNLEQNFGKYVTM